MTFSKTKGLLLFLLALLYLPSEGKEDPVDLIRRHRYDEAVSAWDKDLDGGKLDEKGLRALKGKSLAYFRLGSLYGVYSTFSNAIMAEYYAALLESGASAIHYLYLGQIQYQSGKFADAKSSFEKAKKLGGAGPGILEMVDVFLFFARKRLGEATGEMNLGVKDNSSQWQAMELKGSGAGDIPQGMAGQSQRSRRCKLKILIRSNSSQVADVESTLKAVLNDAQQPEMYLDQGKNTQINFYDPFLMETLSDAYFTLSKLTNLRIKDEEKRFPELAAKFNTDQALAESCARLGQWKEAATYLPKDGDIESQLVKAEVLAHSNKVGEAKSLLESVSNSAKNPSDQRDIADCYYLLGFDLDKGLKLAGQAVREKNGPNYYRTYANLLFATGQTESAMQQYAKGYKIEYRNRIDQIDPEYMTDYAFAIFKTNKLRYEEIVETLYHLQKEFPACRQMHYCMQGISAGLARSYESQRIFRKGG
ncbi:MAG: hypothetical protein JWO30_706 [Fibrobacteres bacterium]|nr:hypothetical protein [Fibrobacterota bacterium]